MGEQGLTPVNIDGYNYLKYLNGYVKDMGGSGDGDNLYPPSRPIAESQLALEESQSSVKDLHRELKEDLAKNRGEWDQIYRDSILENTTLKRFVI